MHRIVQKTLLCSILVVLTACGGDSTPKSTATMTVLAVGTTSTLGTNSAVLVPAGTTVTSPNGTVVTLNGDHNTLYTQTGATVRVPISATGPADNEVSTGPAPGGSAVTSTALVTAIAGSATTNSAPADGTGTAAILWGGGQMVLDNSGNIIMSDRGILRKVTPAGVVTTIWGDLVAGNPCNFDRIAIDSAGNIYGDGPDSNFISLSPLVTGASINELTASGTLVHLVTDWVTYTNNSAGSRGLVRDAGGNLYLTDWLNNRIVKITPAGVRSVFAGSGASGAGDGVGVAATFSSPYGLAIDAANNIYVADTGNAAVRKITPDGTVSSYAHMPGSDLLGPIAIDPSGNIFLAGFPSSLLRVDASRNITSFPLPQVPDFISSLLADGQGHLYANTRGTGAQVLKITF